MKANETRVRALFQGQQHYIIPLFQRPYSWRRDSWETLWKDIIEVYQYRPEGGHFLGPTVAKSLDATPEGVTEFMVIDGQQRLTTLTIIVAALRDKIKSKDPVAGERLDDLVLVNKYASGEHSYKIRPTSLDRDSYKALIDGRRHAIGENDRNAVIDAYDYFFAALDEPIEDTDEALNLTRLERVLLDEMEVVSVTLGDSDNEYRIFESLNWKGESLSQADLLRNYFFMRIAADEQQELYDEVWVPMQSMLTSVQIAEFFRYQHMSTGEFVREKDIYAKWRNSLERLDPKALSERLRELGRFSQLYKRMIDPIDAEPDPDVRDRMVRLNRWGGQTMYPFLLWIYEGADGRDITPSDITQILGYIESYLVRRLFSGIPTAGSNRFFIQLTGQIHKGPITESVREALALTTGRLRWPRDEEFIKGLREYNLYEGSRAEQRRLVLESFELERDHKEPAHLHGLTIEHVMPRELTSEWQESLGENASLIHSEFLHTLGNLTLTGYNSELSNRPFTEKKGLLKESNLAMNKEIAEEFEWGPEEILSRVERLAARAIRIWPGPPR